MTCRHYLNLALCTTRDLHPPRDLRTHPDFDEQCDVGAGDGGESARHDGVQLGLGQLGQERPQKHARLSLGETDVVS